MVNVWEGHLTLTHMPEDASVHQVSQSPHIASRVATIHDWIRKDSDDAITDDIDAACIHYRLRRSSSR